MKPVKIPKTLIEKLKPFGPRFIIVAKPIPGVPKSGKQALEKGWKDNPYEADDLLLQNWLKFGGNYGIVAGEGLGWLDLDDPRMQKLFEEHVETLTIQSGSGSGRHYGFRTDATENATILDKPDKNGQRENLGNLQIKNKYVVGPGSNHYTGGTYKIIKDVPFAWVSKEKLEEIFGEYLVWSRRKESEEQAKQEIEKMKDLGFQIPITNIVDLSKLTQISEYEYQGSHPIHGSTTGHNFCVNIKKNVWHCFRCNSGGGPLSWLAVKHGLIQCHEAQKGALRGELFKKVLEIAKKEGFEIKLGEDVEEKIEPEVAKYFEGKPPRFIPAYLATELLEEFHYVTRETDEVIFVYDHKTGVYKPNGEAHIKREVKKRLGKHFRRNRLNEVTSYVIASTIQEIKEPDPHLILIKNGILDLRTKELKPFSKEYFFLNALPVKYDPETDCPKIKKFLSEIVAPEDVPVLQEIAGYCLWRDYFIHKAVMLIGEGANGKSTFLELLRAMLGNHNVSTIPLQEFESNRFALASLYGKLANIYADLSDTALRKTGLFKMLTGGDTISAEFKFRDKFYFKNYAKLIFSCNKVPRTPDDTTAFFRRWIIVNFPNQFTDDNPKTDKNLIQKLTTEKELSGFFNYALEGLQGLLENGKFSYSKSTEETREAYVRASDPVQAFIMDCLEYAANSFETKENVYKAFIEYCHRMKIPTVAKNVFGAKLPQYIPQVKSVQKRMDGKKVRCWKGIKLVDTKDTKEQAFHNYCTYTENNSNNKESKSKSSLEEPAPSAPSCPTLEEWQDFLEHSEK